jgi:hypothetical protein
MVSRQSSCSVLHLSPCLASSIEPALVFCVNLCVLSVLARHACQGRDIDRGDVRSTSISKGKRTVRREGRT